MSNFTVHQGDALESLKEMEDNTFHAVLTDPPYGLSETPDMAEVLSHWLNGDDYEHKGKGFLGKSWDSFVPGPSVWTEMLRVCRPGAILMAYCGTRTADLMSIAIRLGGWKKIDEVDVYGTIDWLSWIYASGFPKSFNLSRQFDKRAGEQGEVIESLTVPDQRNGHGREYGSHLYAHSGRENITHEHYAPVSVEAKRWYDYGTTLCPAHEVILVFRKEREGTFLDNANTWGTGALNIGGGRIPTSGKDKEKHLAEWDREQSTGDGDPVTVNPGQNDIDLRSYAKEGRWPKNVIFSDGDGKNLSDVLADQSGYSKSVRTERGAGINGNLFKSPKYDSTTRGHEDAGTAKRFFYVSKASRREREFGLPEGNKHPTLKPIQLNKYIATIIRPPSIPGNEMDAEDGAQPKLLIPYSGVASEAIGAYLAGWDDITGLEYEEEYAELAVERFNVWCEVSQLMNTDDVAEILTYDPDSPVQVRLV